MRKKLTFKEHLESKNFLRQALSNTPKTTTQYTIRKYCKLVLGESTDKQYITLKPNNIVEVKWLYEDIDNPTPLSVSFPDINNTQFNSFWEGRRLLGWLKKNARSSS